MMEEQSISEEVSSEGQVSVKIFSVEDLRKQVPHWDRLTKSEKLVYLDTLNVPEDINKNTTTDLLNESIVDMLNPGDSSSFETTHLALGTNGSGGTSASDTGLNTEVERVSVTSVEDNGSNMVVRTFVDSTEGNGNTLDEVGLFTAESGGRLLNHSTISSVVKDNTKTMIVDATLTFSVV